MAYFLIFSRVILGQIQETVLTFPLKFILKRFWMSFHFTLKIGKMHSGVQSVIPQTEIPYTVLKLDLEFVHYTSGVVMLEFKWKYFGKLENTIAYQ